MKCSICGEEFVNIGAVSKHRSIVHNKQQIEDNKLYYKCPYCGFIDDQKHGSDGASSWCAKCARCFQIFYYKKMSDGSYIKL